MLNLPALCFAYSRANLPITNGRQARDQPQPKHQGAREGTGSRKNHPTQHPLQFRGVGQAGLDPLGGGLRQGRGGEDPGGTFLAEAGTDRVGDRKTFHRRQTTLVTRLQALRTTGPTATAAHPPASNAG